MYVLLLYIVQRMLSWKCKDVIFKKFDPSKNMKNEVELLIIVLGATIQSLTKKMRCPKKKKKACQ